MSEQPNVTTVNRMTQAIVDRDSETLTSLFTDDFVLHLRGPFATACDHLGVAGILSNGDPQMLAVAVKSAGLDGLLDPLLSVHEIRRYKTDPAAYALGPAALKLPARDILFVSSNGWDAIGATWFGYTTLWVNRSNLPLEQLDTSPTRTGSSLRDVLGFFPT